MHYAIWLSVIAVLTALSFIACIKACKLDAFMKDAEKTNDENTDSNVETTKSNGWYFLLDEFMKLPSGGKGIVIYFLVDLIIVYLYVIPTVDDTSELIVLIIAFYAFHIIGFIILFYIFYGIMSLVNAHNGDKFAQREFAAWITIIISISFALFYE